MRKLSGNLYLIDLFMMLYSRKLNFLTEVFVYPNVLRAYLKKLEPDIALFYWPYVSFITDDLKKRGIKIVYDCVDDFSSFPSAERLRTVEKERKLVSESDLIVVTSRRLQKKMARAKRAAVLIPNAADYKHFAGETAIPEDIKDIPHPIIGFFGAISEWFDEKLVCDVAANRLNWSFVLIGPCTTEKRFRKLSNIFLLGRKPYEVLPAYLQQFDVCIVPFKVNELTLSADPVKVYEYLAGGKPVVSTDLPELKSIPFVKTAKNVEEFAMKIEEALGESKETALVRARQQYACQNTWDVRVDELLDHIKRISDL